MISIIRAAVRSNTIGKKITVVMLQDVATIGQYVLLCCSDVMLWRLVAPLSVRWPLWWRHVQSRHRDQIWRRRVSGRWWYTRKGRLFYRRHLFRGKL